jgi:DNA repair exonuclease SbcCD nuclease subunit
MRILLTADWHVGIRGDSDTYLKIFENYITRFLVPAIRHNKVDSICILGDFFDNRNSINYFKSLILMQLFHN